MKRITVRIIGLSLALLAAGLCASLYSRPAASSSAPRIALDREAHDWGKVPPLSTVETKITLKNTGSQLLTVKRVSTSCGCTKPTLDAESLRRGEETRMAVSLTIPEKPGPVRHFIRIETNDPSRPKVEVNLFATSWSGIQTAPDAVRILDVGPQEEAVTGVQLYSPDRSVFRVLRAFGTISSMDVEVECPGVSLPVHRIRVRYRGIRAAGLESGRLFVLTDKAECPTVVVPVLVEIRGPVLVDPKELQLESGEIGTSVRRSLLVRARGSPRAVAVDNVRASSPWEARLQSARTVGSGATILDVELKRASASRDEDGELLISLASPERTLLHVPLLVRGWRASVGRGSNDAR